MSGTMEDSKNEAVVENYSIREECEELVACENTHPVSSGFFASKCGVMEWMASRPVGQMIFKSVDRVLWCIERTLLWQNPNPDSLVPLVRPVNVLLAYPLAAFLWILQHLMFATSETSYATELIKWVQTRRRRLRAIRFLGIRNMREKHALAKPETRSPFSQIFWFLGKTPSDSKQQSEEVIKKIDDHEEEKIEDDNIDDENSKKRRYSAVSVGADDGIILLENECYNSESDSDYVPDCSLSSESSSDLSSVEEDEDEPEDNVLNGSVRDSECPGKTLNHETSTAKNGDHSTPKD